MNPFAWQMKSLPLPAGFVGIASISRCARPPAPPQPPSRCPSHQHTHLKPLRPQIGRAPRLQPVQTAARCAARCQNMVVGETRHSLLTPPCSYAGRRARAVAHPTTTEAGRPSARVSITVRPLSVPAGERRAFKRTTVVPRLGAPSPHPLIAPLPLAGRPPTPRHSGGTVRRDAPVHACRAHWCASQSIQYIHVNTHIYTCSFCMHVYIYTCACILM